jgi:hypothetical protein
MKAEILLWFSGKNFTYDPTHIRAELLSLVRKTKTKVMHYQLDGTAHCHGHIVGRLLLCDGSCDALELVGSEVKCKVSEYRLSDTEILMNTAPDNTGITVRQSCVKHMENSRNEDFGSEQLFDIAMNMTVARQRFSKHILEVTQSIVGLSLLGSKSPNTDSRGSG